MSDYIKHEFPRSRIATIDIGEIGRHKHHISALIEIDVTESRLKLKELKRNSGDVSFTAWLIKVICQTISNNKEIAAFLKGKRHLYIFDRINVSFLVEKEIDGQKVPIPLVIENVAERTVESINKQIVDSKNVVLTESDIVLQAKSSRIERLYYRLPSFIRRSFWRFLLKFPKVVYGKMGNVAITSVGMIRQINGWFIPISIHPVCFGIGSVIKKPVVVDDEIVVREIMNMTVLIDHDVVDGANMVRFINELIKNIEKGKFL